MARRWRAAGLGCEPFDQKRARLSAACGNGPAAGDVSLLSGGDTISGEEVLPGFLVRGAGVFREFLIPRVAVRSLALSAQSR